MEYMVIGWTNFSDSRFPEVSDEERFKLRPAIIKEIREHGYRFCGDEHEERDGCVPVLNSGEKYCVPSWREWGAIMAQAWRVDNTDGHAYFTFYMSLKYFENPGNPPLSYPTPGVDTSAIVDKAILTYPDPGTEEVYGTHVKKLTDEYHRVIEFIKKNNLPTYTPAKDGVSVRSVIDGIIRSNRLLRPQKHLPRASRTPLISVLGDSVSTLLGYTPDDAVFYNAERKHESGVWELGDTWWGRVAEELSAEILVNNSISGSTVTRCPGCETEAFSASDTRTSGLHIADMTPDIILILMGLNDWGRGVPLTSDGGDADELSTFSGAYSAMLEKLRKNYPGAEIFCLTLPRAKRESGEPFPYEYAGVHIEKYCAAIREAAEKYSCNVSDLYRSAEPYDSIDGFHPNRDGMMKIADAILNDM